MKTTKTTKAVAVKTSNKKEEVKVSRPTILGYSVSSVCKWMGKQGFTTAEATLIVNKLATSPVAPSTIATGLSDGKNAKYNGNAAALSKDEVAKLRKIVKPAAKKTTKSKKTAPAAE